MPDEENPNQTGPGAWLKQLALAELDRLEVDLTLKQWELLDEQLRTCSSRSASGRTRTTMRP